MNANQSIQDLIAASQYSRQLPTVTLFGKKVSSETLWITVCCDIIFILLWFAVGIFDMSRYSWLVFVGYIFFDVYNIFADSTDAELSAEVAFDAMQDHVIRAEGIVGIVVFVYIASFYITLPETVRHNVLTLLTMSLILIALNAMTFATPNDSQYLRSLRIMKVRFANQGILLFCFAILMIIESLTFNG